MNSVRGIAAVAVGAALLAVPVAALATPGDDHKVTICHAKPADTAKNGWVTITVDKASIAKPKGHGTEHDADIIPPFDAYGKVPAYAGKNTDKLDILENGCQITTPTTSPTTPSTTTTSQTSSPTTSSPTSSSPTTSSPVTRPTTTTSSPVTETVPAPPTTTTSGPEPTSTQPTTTSSGPSSTKSIGHVPVTTSTSASESHTVPKAGPKKATELAYTGFNTPLFIAAILLLLLGAACYYITRTPRKH